jgi:hypothetical protein
MSRNLQLITLLRKCFSGDKICIFYRGNFDDIFTDKLISLAEHEVEKKSKKRVSFLISESFQNIVRHGNNELSNNNDSLFGIRAVTPYSHIFSSNTITENEKNYLEEKLTFINKLDAEELKQLYLKVLEEGSLSDKGGAGLGLIEMAKKSKKPIQMDFKRLNDNSFSFNMQIDLIVDENESEGEKANQIPMTIEENTAMYDLMTDNNMIFLYKGDFNDETISPMLNILEGNTVDTGNSIGYKIYHTAVELMQNVVRHSSDPNTKEGIFAINKTENGYFLCTGNYVKNEAKNIGSYIDKLNALDKQELNTLYRQQLKESVVVAGNSAGVGLIDLRRSFMTPIEMKFVEDKNGSYLTIGIEIPFTNGK